MALTSPLSGDDCSLKLNLKISCEWDSSQANLRKPVWSIWSIAILTVFIQIDQAKEKWSILKHKDSLREKKKLCFNGNHNVQLWVLNFSVVNCLQNFVLRMCLWMPYRSQHLIIFPEMFSLQTTFFAWFHSSKVLAFENLCNWFMICCML